MAGKINEGEKLYIPFIDGESVLDSQLRPRIYKSVEQFDKKYPYSDVEKVKLVEYAPVKESKWIQLNKTQEHYCERCGASFNLYAYCKNDYLYCPQCGSRMRNGGEV